MKTRTALSTLTPKLLGLIVLLFGLFGCATAPAATSVRDGGPSGAPVAQATAAPSAPKSASTVVDTTVPVQVRLVIKNADLTLVVEDPGGGMTTIMNMVNEMGGYVVTSKSFKTRAENGIEVPQATLSVRVPAEKLDAALAQTKKLVKDPTQDIRVENISGQDVTADYVDQQARLTNLQNTQKQLQRLQETATKTDEVLTVLNKLTEVGQQIEQIKGKMKYYEEASALSSINISLLSKAGIAPLTIGGWEPIGIVRDAFQTLIDIGKTLVEILIWLVIVFLPVGLVLYFPGRLLWRWIRKLTSRPRPTMPMPPMPYGNMPMMPPYPMQGPANMPGAPEPPRQPGPPPENHL